MKKKISMLLVCALSALLLVGCGSGVAGTYEAVKVEVNGQEMELDAVGKLIGGSLEATLTLEKDGKAEAIAKTNGKEQKGSGTWTEEGDKIIIKSDTGSTETYTKKDGCLTVEMNGMKLILEKK